MSKEKDIIKVAVEAGKGIAVHAKGNSAQIVAVGAAAGITAVCVGIGYGGYIGTKKAIEWVKE